VPLSDPRPGLVRETPGEEGGEPCITCGACCFSRLATYVRVDGDDYTRLGSSAEDLVWFDENRAYLVMRDGRCSALELEVPEGRGPPRFVCRIYDVRPRVCRELYRGSAACEGERAEKSDRPREAAQSRVFLRVEKE
jgi:Fe-S-cluster containining protein